ncbi:hypothetical protein IAT38_006650 [Cryptococcus sp. DSM 104549]
MPVPHPYQSNSTEYRPVPTTDAHSPHYPIDPPPHAHVPAAGPGASQPAHEGSYPDQGYSYDQLSLQESKPPDHYHAGWGKGEKGGQRGFSAGGKVRVGKPKKYHALPTRAEKIYMGIAVVEAVIICAIASSIFGLIEANVHFEDSKLKSVPVYLAIFILAQLFSLLYVFDALRARNIIQLILHLTLHLMLLLYAILQIPQTRTALRSAPPDACGRFTTCAGPGPGSLYSLLQKLMIVPPVVFAVAMAGFGVLVKRLYVQFGWAVFHLVGASPEMKQMHRAYQTLISLLKLLLFFAMSFCIAYLILVTAWDTKRFEFIITVVALPLVFVLIFICGWALRKEHKPVMAICLVAMVAGVAYFSYKLTTLWLPRTSGLYVNTKITMAILSIFAIIILLVTFAFGCLCMSNFGKGLVEAHRNPENRTSLWSLPANLAWEKSGGGVEAGGGRAGVGQGEGGQGVTRIVIE